MGEEILWIRGIYKTEMFIRAVIMSKSAGGGGGGGEGGRWVGGQFPRNVK